MNNSEANNIIIATSVMVALLDHAQQIGRLLKTAQSQGRDITREELDELVGEDDAAKAMLDKAIAAHKRTQAVNQITGSTP